MGLEPTRLVEKDELDLILAGGSYSEKVRILGELEAALRAPTGGRARMRRLTRKERSALAADAAKARWRRTTKAERSEAMRKRVMARWEKARR